jgi:hypothetical protein
MCGPDRRKCMVFYRVCGCIASSAWRRLRLRRFGSLVDGCYPALRERACVAVVLIQLCMDHVSIRGGVQIPDAASSNPAVSAQDGALPIVHTWAPSTLLSRANPHTCTLIGPWILIILVSTLSFLTCECCVYYAALLRRWLDAQTGLEGLV